MKKIIFLCFCALLASCTSDEDLQDINTNEKELANMINDYELVLKGYSLDELKKEKDELTPTTQEETVAEPWLIKAIQDSIAQIQFSYNDRTRTDAGAYTRAVAMEGVFKYETCGGYREFVYLMDCEDGGDTHSSGIGATRVDGNGNVEFHFCVIPASLSPRGGTLVFYQPDIKKHTVILRHHDNEDHNNKNHITDNAGLASFAFFPVFKGKCHQLFFLGKHLDLSTKRIVSRFLIGGFPLGGRLISASVYKGICQIRSHNDQNHDQDPEPENAVSPFHLFRHLSALLPQ